MADAKISQLSAATTPLVGTEVLPIVQSGSTKKVSVSDLTAGRAISATSVTASTGNFVVGTSGQGIDFSATPGTGTSELLADYEEGTWTPAAATWSIAPVFDIATYTKVGRLVTLTVVGHGGSCLANSTITGLPFNCSSSSCGAVLATSDSASIAFTGCVFNNATSITRISASTISNTVYWTMSCSYFV